MVVHYIKVYHVCNLCIWCTYFILCMNIWCVEGQVQSSQPLVYIKYLHWALVQKPDTIVCKARPIISWNLIFNAPTTQSNATPCAMMLQHHCGTCWTLWGVLASGTPCRVREHLLTYPGEGLCWAARSTGTCSISMADRNLCGCRISACAAAADTAPFLVRICLLLCPIPWVCGREGEEWGRD